RRSPTGVLRVITDIAVAAAQGASSQRERDSSSTAAAQPSITTPSGTKAGVLLGARETAWPNASFSEAFGSQTAEPRTGRNRPHTSMEPISATRVRVASGHKRRPARRAGEN